MRCASIAAGRGASIAAGLGGLILIPLFIPAACFNLAGRVTCWILDR